MPVVAGPAAGRAAAGPAARSPGLPAGLRWIAVRPGAPMPRRPSRRGLGPTPRYAYIPRWGLSDGLAPVPAEPEAPVQQGPAPETVERVLRLVLVMLGLAALVHLLRYLLLMLNRTMLLHPLVAAGANVLAILAELGALAALLGLAIVATRWLICRREAVFAGLGQVEPRSRETLWVGCLVPLVNLFWAPVYVVELARADGRYGRLRRPIAIWWVLWVLSALLSTAVTVISLLAVLHAYADDLQGVADTTMAAVVCYLLAALAVVALRRVFDAFEIKTVDRPTRRWVVVADAGAGAKLDRAAAPEKPALEDSAPETPAPETPAPEDAAPENPAA